MTSRSRTLRRSARSLLSGAKPSRSSLAFSFLQVVEELALVLRGADFDQSVGVQQVPENVGSCPPGGVGIKADVFRRVELFDRLEQADVPFLNQIHVVGAGVEILRRNGDGHPQVGQDELHGRIATAPELIFLEEPELFFFAEVGIPPDFSQVLLEGGDRDQ
jgi:hypothetical protein